MNAKGALHIVNGKQLCEQQYAHWRENDGCRRGFEAGIREVVELDKDIMQHILQDGEGNWSIESWRLKAFYRRRQAQLKKWGIKQ